MERIIKMVKESNVYKRMENLSEPQSIVVGKSKYLYAPVSQIPAEVEVYSVEECYDAFHL